MKIINKAMFANNKILQFGTIIFIMILLNLNTPIFAQNLGIGVTTPLQLLDIGGKIRIGNDATTPVGGTLRYNNSSQLFEGHNGTTWINLLGNYNLPSGSTSNTLRNNGSGWVSDNFMQNTGSEVKIGTNNNILSGALRVYSGNSHAVYGKSTGAFSAGLYGESDIYGVFGVTNSGTGVKGTSSIGYGVKGESNTNYGVFGSSISQSGVVGESQTTYGVYGYSATSYGGGFYGRIRLRQGGNGDAGIDFENNATGQAGYVGMYGNDEMMVWGYSYGAPIQRWNIITGSICYASTPTICSDIRIKKNFSSLSNSLFDVQQLKGYHYFLKNDRNPNLQTGFIAQEVQKIFPELVETDSEGYLSVNYVGLVPHLVEAIKSLSSENEILLNRLARIEKHLNLQEIEENFSTKK